MLGATIVLAMQLRRARPPLWELIVLAVLAVATLEASRAGVWLLFFLAVPAARGFRVEALWTWVMPPVAALASVILVLSIVRGPIENGAGNALLARAISLADGTPVLADDLIGEQVALAHGRVWVSDPIDAFSHQDQSTYLDWFQGFSSGLRAIRPDIRVVLTAQGSPSARLMARDPSFAEVQADRRSELWLRGGATHG
jgi:hypothetical protein